MWWLDLLATGGEAATRAPAFGVFTDYLNLGFITVVLGLAYTRKVRFEGEVQEKDERIAKLEAAISMYTEHYQKEVLPALIDVTKLSGDLVAYLNKHQH